MLVLAAVSALAAENWANFADPEAAGDFGWAPAQNSVLEITTESQSGANALLARPKPDAKPYNGLVLSKQIDLAGATEDDYIEFNIRQNYGTRMRILVSLPNKVAVYANPQLPGGQWKTVRIPLDIEKGNWRPVNENVPFAGWGMVSSISIYAKNFDAAGESMIVDNLRIVLGGEEIPASGKAGPDEPPIAGIPGQDANNYYLGDSNVTWRISKETGAVTGGWWGAKPGMELHGVTASYFVEKTNATTLTGRENRDRAKLVEFRDGHITIAATNPEIPGMSIHKEYFCEDGRLHKITTFDRPGDVRFITCNGETVFSDAFRQGGYYMGAGWIGPITPVPLLSERKKIDMYRNSSKGMLLHSPRAGGSFAHVRLKLDGNFVWPWFTCSIAGYLEKYNALHYTPRGWDMSLGTSRLDPVTSFEEYFSFFPGGPHAFLTKEYPSVPDVAAEFKRIPPRPDWVNDIYAYDNSGDINRLKRLIAASREGEVMALFSQISSWGDYYVEDGVEGHFGGWTTGPELLAHTQKIKGISPRVKFGIYNFSASVFPHSRLYKKHPGWVRERNIDGQPIDFFPGMGPNYGLLYELPEVRRELLKQFESMFSYLGVDYLYLDEARAINFVDWEKNLYNRDDYCFDLYRGMKQLAAKHGNDKVIFFNARGNPYADINFIEARSQLRDGYWRHFAGMAVGMNLFQSNVPGARIIPLYWTPPMARDYINRVLALGWVPSITYGDLDSRRPYLTAAYQVGKGDMPDVVMTPDWKVDPKTDLESYALRRRGDSGVLLSLIDHEKGRRKLPAVQINRDSLGLARGKNLFVWRYEIANAHDYKNQLSEPLAAQTYRQSGWELDRVTIRGLARTHTGDQLAGITIENPESVPLQLYQYYFTTAPALVYAVDSLPQNYLFAKTKHAGVREISGGWEAYAGNKAAEFVAPALPGMYIKEVKLGGKTVPLRPTVFAGGVAAKFTVPSGKHQLSVAYAPIAEIPSARLAVVTGGDALAIKVENLPSGASPLLQVRLDGMQLYAGTPAEKNGAGWRVKLPGGLQGGNYEVLMRYALLPDGQVVSPETSEPAAVTLKAVPAKLNLPEKMPRLPAITKQEKCDLDLDHGARITARGTYISASNQNGLLDEMPRTIATAAPENKTFGGGTTRKPLKRYSAAGFGGFEISGAQKIELQVASTFPDATHNRGQSWHSNNYTKDKRLFAGFIADYATGKGYTHRALFSAGVMWPDCETTGTPFPAFKQADAVYQLGQQALREKNYTLRLNLADYAPEGWDGRVWLSLGGDQLAPQRRLFATITAVNAGVKGEITKAEPPLDTLALYNKPRRLEIPRAPHAPIIDGLIDDEMWQSAAKIDGLYIVGGRSLPKQQTQVRTFYDDRFLYVGFICSDTERRLPIVKNGPVWHDDTVEVWLDANRDAMTFYQLIANGRAKTNAFNENGPGKTRAVVKAQPDGSGRWHVELAIPFGAIGATPKRGDIWRANFARSRLPGPREPQELQTWSPLRKDGFRDLRGFCELEFK